MARICTRTDGDLIIGRNLQDILEPDTIYEIKDYGLGEIILIKIGKCNNSNIWKHNIDTILDLKLLPELLLTTKELENATRS